MSGENVENSGKRQFQVLHVAIGEHTVPSQPHFLSMVNKNTKELFKFFDEIAQDVDFSFKEFNDSIVEQGGPLSIGQAVEWRVGDLKEFLKNQRNILYKYEVTTYTPCHSMVTVVGEASILKHIMDEFCIKGRVLQSRN
ncbi:hypothetical protein TCAL_16104 [Tigriopus californicus]|uniref:Uncharacterized protein n=1 Tax=Tigriopus californicus TaxID=6832 RepID=A0A553PNB7_TIGCA|nr:uncharacterized protein LOC131882141 [Tigriopus californicus]TRY79178.1 hypothetical protein TCAL_16104 [Tigriopus californicus]